MMWRVIEISMDEMIKREELSILAVAELFIRFIEGDSTASIDMLKNSLSMVQNIPDYLFYCNLKSVWSELGHCDTAKRKIGKKLAQSEYGSKYGQVLLHYINAFESEEKGKFLACLLDSVSHDFIDVNECFIYCKYIVEVTLPSLIYLKKNINKKVIYNTRNDKVYVKELLRNGLMYEAEKNGKGFDLDAFYLDKFSLSYNEEKYGYTDKNEGIPKAEDFPKVPVYLTTR